MDVAKYRAMLASGAPDWDVVDIAIDFLNAGRADGLFEKIDTAIVSTKRGAPQFVDE